ncbi:LuxR family transcriptional regulator [Nesterenkonia sp. Act20]|uniref:LuxR family transcriptional regulator n=1 Tax=Nesterenkonia sp. Act20 TaxID=1483432 RepID=UPI001C46AFB7|nr:LuxR family transcriptional regulator [Nesterenkonia sp. Act20]
MQVEGPHGVIGRDAQRAKILSAIYSARAGRSTICFLEGTIGSGKTALAGEARARAASAGLTVVSFADVESGEDVCEALRRHGSGPYCLVAEDFHLAGPEVHAGLVKLLEAGAFDPEATCTVLLLMTVSPTVDPLARRFARAAARTGTRITLRGITRAEMAKLLQVHGHRLSEEMLSRIHSRSAGNPGIAVSLAATCRTADEVSTSDIPTSFLRSDVEHLTPPLRTFLEVLALDGRHARAEELADVAAQTLRSFAPEEDQALQTDSLLDALSPILTGNGREVQLADQTWSEAAQALITPARLHLIHLLLAQRTTGLARARHLAAATPGRDPGLAQELESQGATALQDGDYSGSAEYLALAMRVSRGEDRRRLLISAGLTMGLAESPPGVIELFAEIDVLGDVPLAAFLRAGMAFFTGHLDEARSLLLAQLRSPREEELLEDIVRWRMLILLCSVEIAAANEQAAQAAVAQARELGIVPNSPIDQVMARVMVMHEVYALWNTGAIEEAISCLDVFLIEAADTAEHTDALYFRGRVHFYAGHTAAALDDLERAEEGRHQKVVPAAAQRGMAEQAVMEFHLGRWSDAILRAERVIAMAGTTRDWRGLASSHAVLAMVAVAHADETAAAEHVDWLTHHVTTSSALPLYNVMTALAWTARMSGDHERALAVIADFRRTRLYAWADSVGLIGWRALEIGALVDLENPGRARLAEAERLLKHFTQKVAQRPGLPLPYGHPLALQAKLAAKRGDLDSAVQDYRASIWLAAEFPHIRARLHHALGVVHRQRGEHAEAEEQLEAARDIFAQLGAAPELSDVKSRLLSVAGRYASLTPRERDMAYLISQGRTNREIAENLFVSIKTVEYHVSNLLPKLGISSRRELWTSAAVASQRISPPDQVPGFSPGIHV